MSEYDRATQERPTQERATYQRSAYEQPGYDPAHRAGDPSWPPAAAAPEQHRPVGVAEPRTQEHGWPPVAPAAGPAKRTFSAKVTAAIAAGAFLVGAAAAILVGGLTGPGGAPGGGPGGTPPGVYGSQNGGTGTGTTPGTGTGTGTTTGQGTGT